MTNRKPLRLGFTLIELLVAIGLLAMIAPIVFRLYHEGLAKNYNQANIERRDRAMARGLFRQLGTDLTNLRRTGTGEAVRTPDAATLVLTVWSPEKRSLLLDSEKDLASFEPQDKDLDTVVYRLDEKGGLHRFFFRGLAAGAETRADAAAGRALMMSGVRSLEYTFEKTEPNAPAWMRVIVTMTPSGRMGDDGRYEVSFPVAPEVIP